MLKELSEIAPTSIFIALALWAGLSYFVAAPEIAARVAHFDYVPQCEANIVANAENALQTQLSQYASDNADREQAAQGVGQINGILNNSFGDSNYSAFMDKYGTNPFDLLTGGALSRMQESLSQKLRTQREEFENRANIAMAKVVETAPSQCACQAKLAFLENRTDWTLYTGSFGLVKPEAVENHGQAMRVQIKTCFGRVG